LKEHGCNAPLVTTTKQPDLNAMALLHTENENGPVERVKRPDYNTWYQLQVYM
jgi:hypothetical protein